MDKKNENKMLSEYNSIMKENDDIYRGIARAMGLPDCAFWILYALRESSKILTQSEICDALYQPKQTVNSALKKLEADGCINLTEKDDRRSKQITLTGKGLKLAGTTVDKVLAVEHETWAEISPDEQETFIRIFRKYTDLFRDHIQKIY